MSIDNKTLNNILKRALTKPSLDDDLIKKIKMVVVLLVVIGLAVLFAVFKIVNVESLITAMGVL